MWVVCDARLLCGVFDVEYGPKKKLSLVSARKTAVKIVFLPTIKSMAGSAASELIIYVRLVTF